MDFFLSLRELGWGAGGGGGGGERKENKEQNRLMRPFQRTQSGLAFSGKGREKRWKNTSPGISRSRGN